MSSITNAIKASLRCMRKLTILGIAVILAVLLVRPAAVQGPPYDLVLRNGRIVDGTGNLWYRGDVAIQGATIVRVGPSITESVP